MPGGKGQAIAGANALCALPETAAKAGTAPGGLMRGAELIKSLLARQHCTVFDFCWLSDRGCADREPSPLMDMPATTHCRNVVSAKLSSSHSTLLVARRLPSQSSGKPMIATSAAMRDVHVPWNATPTQAGKTRSGQAAKQKAKSLSSRIVACNMC